MTGSVPERAEPTQPSVRRLRRYDIRPRRDLGQNFLVDSNLLGVIERVADLDRLDVVLEVGGGLGVLSEYLAARVAHTHIVEIDRTLEQPLREALSGFDNCATLHFADALELDLAALRPAPNKIVANLPYGIAATLILKTIGVLPSVTRWVAMVQKEVGQRFVAAPGSDAYGIPSVLAQYACRVRTARAISRRVFYPVPNVDSSLIVLERIGPAASSALRSFVGDAFAHRRKALARSLALTAAADGDKRRERTRLALAALGLPENIRAERIGPQQFAALQRLVEHSS